MGCLTTATTLQTINPLEVILHTIAMHSVVCSIYQSRVCLSMIQQATYHSTTLKLLLKLILTLNFATTNGPSTTISTKLFNILKDMVKQMDLLTTHYGQLHPHTLFLDYQTLIKLLVWHSMESFYLQVHQTTDMTLSSHQLSETNSVPEPLKLMSVSEHLEPTILTDITCTLLASMTLP